MANSPDVRSLYTPTLMRYLKEILRKRLEVEARMEASSLSELKTEPTESKGDKCN